MCCTLSRWCVLGAANSLFSNAGLLLHIKLRATKSPSFSMLPPPPSLPSWTPRSAAAAACPQPFHPHASTACVSSYPLKIHNLSPLPSSYRRRSRLYSPPPFPNSRSLAVFPTPQRRSFLWPTRCSRRGASSRSRTSHYPIRMLKQLRDWNGTCSARLLQIRLQVRVLGISLTSYIATPIQQRSRDI